VEGLFCYWEGSNGKDTLRAVCVVVGKGMTGKLLSDFKSYDIVCKFILVGLKIWDWAFDYFKSRFG
jgi:putative DNA primase/helicase